MPLALGSSTRAQSKSSTPSVSSECTIGRIVDSVLIVGGHRAYIEPQSFVAEGNRVLLAGTPTYLWETGDRPALVSGDSTIGAILDASGRVSPLPSPVAVRLVNDVRAAAAGAGKWAVMFAEAEPVRPQQTAHVTAYWFGLTDGERWTDLRRLEIRDGRPRSIAASALVRSAQGFALAVPIDRDERRDVMIVEWDGESITREVVETKAAAYVALAATSGNDLLLGVVRPDTTEREDENSLFVYRRNAATRSWEALPRTVRGEGQPVRDPSISVGAAGVVVSWRVTPKIDSTEARALITQSLTAAISKPLILGRGVEHVLDVARMERLLWVIASRPTSHVGSRLRVIAVSGAHTSTVAALASPFSSTMAGVWLGGSLLLTGGVLGATASALPVESHVMSIDVRCRAAP